MKSNVIHVNLLLSSANFIWWSVKKEKQDLGVIWGQLNIARINSLLHELGQAAGAGSFLSPYIYIFCVFLHFSRSKIRLFRFRIAVNAIIFFFFFSVHSALLEELPRSESGYCLETRQLEKLLLLPKSMNSREKNYFTWLISVYQIYYLQKITWVTYFLSTC